MKHTDYCQTRRLPNIPMLKHSKEFFMLTFTLWFMSENNVKSKTHLINLVPLWVDSLMDDLALEEFRPESEDAVRVWLAFDQSPEELVFTHQVVGFYKVDPQDALSNRGVLISLNLKQISDTTGWDMSRSIDKVSSVTLGMGKRSWASWDSPTRGMEMRLGRTR